MKVEKRNGGYRVQPMRNGKRYSLTFDHKPTKADIEEALFDAIAKDMAQSDITVMTFETAAKKYNDSKRNVVSPCTIRDYDRMCGRFPEWFINTKVCDITQEKLNVFVNELSIDKSPKTVKNYHGFVSSVLGVYNPKLSIKTRLPMEDNEEPYIPTKEDIALLIQDVKGRPYEVGIHLACYGLTRSEMLGINVQEDLSKDITTVNKIKLRELRVCRAKVQDTDDNWIIKNYGKTEARCRTIFIDNEIAKLMDKQGFVFEGHPNNLTEYLYRFCDNYSIPRFSLHKLRHYYASKLIDMGIPITTVQKLGGWKTDHVLKKIYAHSLKSKKELQGIASKYTKAIFS